MSLASEFKEFAVKGNVVDLAVGVIIGAAFGKIVDSAVKDIIMPPIGLITGKTDFASLYINLSDKTFGSLQEAQKAGAPTINYGLFLNNVISFLIVAFVVFLMVKAINRLRRSEAVAPTVTPAPTREETLLTEIRDLLTAQRGV